jgi:hypothetical protein
MVISRLVAVGLVTFAALMLPVVSGRQPERSAPDAATFEVPDSRVRGLHGVTEKTSHRGLLDRYDERLTCGMSLHDAPLGD